MTQNILFLFSKQYFILFVPESKSNNTYKNGEQIDSDVADFQV